jgi:DNA-binding NtrC family response regulator
VDDLPEPVQYYNAPRPATSMAHESYDTPMPLEQALEGPERRIIEAALHRNSWNRQNTAAELDINRTTLYKKMRKYRLDLGESNWTEPGVPLATPKS